MVALLAERVPSVVSAMNNAFAIGSTDTELARVYNYDRCGCRDNCEERVGERFCDSELSNVPAPLPTSVGLKESESMGPAALPREKGLIFAKRCSADVASRC